MRQLQRVRTGSSHRRPGDPEWQPPPASPSAARTATANVALLLARISDLLGERDHKN